MTNIIIVVLREAERSRVKDKGYNETDIEEVLCLKMRDIPQAKEYRPSLEAEKGSRF